MASVNANTGTANDSTSAVGQVTDSAKQAASQVGDLAQQQAKSQLRSRKNQAADSVDSVVNALHQVSSQLRKDNQDQIANATDLAAGQLGRVSDYLESTSVNQVLRDVENVARQQPALFLTGAFALGVLAARFIKSSAPSQQGNWRNNQYSGWSNAQNWNNAPRYQQIGTQGNVGTNWQATSAQGGTQGWTSQQARENRKNGAPYGVYDPGSTGVQVREIPQ